MRESSEGTPCGALLTPAVFGVSSLSGFRRRNVEIWGLSAANVTRYWKNDLIGVQTAPQRLKIELREQILERREEVSNALVSGDLGQDGRRWRRWRRGSPPMKGASPMPFPGRQMSAIADALGPHILLEAGGLLLTLLSFCAASGGSKGCAHRTKSSEVV